MPTAKAEMTRSRGVAVKSARSAAMSCARKVFLTMYGVPYNYDSRRGPFPPWRRCGWTGEAGGDRDDAMRVRPNGTTRGREGPGGRSSELRPTLDAFRRIVQALRVGA